MSKADTGKCVYEFKRRDKSDCDDYDVLFEGQRIGSWQWIQEVGFGFFPIDDDIREKHPHDDVKAEWERQREEWAASPEAHDPSISPEMQKHLEATQNVETSIQEHYVSLEKPFDFNSKNMRLVVHPEVEEYINQQIQEALKPIRVEVEIAYHSARYAHECAVSRDSEISGKNTETGKESLDMARKTAKTLKELRRKLKKMGGKDD